MERSSRVLQHGNPFFLSLKLNFVCSYPEKRNEPGLVNISPTSVIDTSIERSSQVLQQGNPKICFFSKKFEIEF